MRAAAMGAPPGEPSTIGVGGATAGPCPVGCATPEPAAGRRDPQETQNRLATGFRVEHVVQMGPSSSRESKLKAGASGRDRPPNPGSAAYSPGSGTTPKPTGGVGGTSPAGDGRRRPQSWQNARFSGLLRPQRSQITSPKGNPQDTGTSSTFQCPHLGRAGGRAVSHAPGNAGASRALLFRPRTATPRRSCRGKTRLVAPIHKGLCADCRRKFGQSLDVSPKLRLNAWSRCSWNGRATTAREIAA